MKEENQNREKELQENVAFRLSSKEKEEQRIVLPKNTVFQNLHNPSDGTQEHLRNVVNQHKNVLPQSSNFIEEQEQEKENAFEQVADQVAAKGISAATGGAIPKEEAEKVVNVLKMMKIKTIPQRILEFLGFISKKITDSPILSKIVLSFGISLFVFILFMSSSMISIGRESIGKDKLVSYLSVGLDDEHNSLNVIEYLQQGGWCSSRLDCMNSQGYYFLSTFRRKIKDQLEKYEELNEENDCLNQLTMTEEFTSLLLGTIFFNRSNDELLSTDSLFNSKMSQYEQEMDYIINALYEADEPWKENTCYRISKDAYQDAIIGQNGYIDRFRGDLGSNLSSELKLQIYQSILSDINYFMKNPIIASQGSYVECSGVTVVDDNNNIIGTYTLEDYVAGVLSKETYDYFPLESKKALAVAARTYVLSRTNSCKTSIESSSNLQNFNKDIRDSNREVAKATEGQILVDSAGKIFDSEYDSWNCIGQNTCTYEKKPYGEIHQVTISDKYLHHAAGGHGCGMSQIAAADLADQGMNYEQILKFFYSDGVQLSSLTRNMGFASGGKYISTAPLHKDVASLQNSKWYPNIGHLTGQCVWYAKNRAQEILYYSNMPEELKQRAITSIQNTSGNGEAWYRNPDGNLFAKSADATQPRAGAIVSWSGGKRQENTNYYYGHVAIIESVNADGTVTISEGWKEGSWDSASWSTVRYRKFNVTIDYIKQHSYSGKTYYFNGYVYLLG